MQTLRNVSAALLGLTGLALIVGSPGAGGIGPCLAVFAAGGALVALANLTLGD